MKRLSDDETVLVTDLEWASAAMRMFAFVVPCPVRQFSKPELAQAVQRVAKS